MAVSVTKSSKYLSVTAYVGDCKTLLAFNLPDKKSAANLAGFTIKCAPDGQPSYYLQNTLQFQTPGDHAQDAKEPANSSINAPFHKFRWLHVPGTVHQGVKPYLGNYTYTVTARYFDDKQSLQPLDPARSVSVTVTVGPFSKNGLELGFTRGYSQSQAFVHHFGLKALIQPPTATRTLLFNTAQMSGSDAAGNKYTYADEYDWLGFTARERIFAVLTQVLNDATLYLDMFAYDLNEPDLLNILLQLAKQGRVRIILDNAALHHSAKKPTAEDQFEQLFDKAAREPAEMKRGHFRRYAHDKVFVVTDRQKALKVLTGSTNFSVTGLYVNSNHVLVYSDPDVAAEYWKLFKTVWDGDAQEAPYLAAPISQSTFTAPSNTVPTTGITFAPHSQQFATQILNGVATRIGQEGKKAKGVGSVLFAVMEIDQGTSPVYAALKTLHANQKIFSYGISDSTKGISLYAPGRKTGVLVTGKPGKSQLPPPFDQVPTIGGIGHQIHHKFVVCGFNTDDAVVYCGSSNLALGGEQQNGDNLLEIHDQDVATVFAIEALGLVDHFDFLDRYAAAPKSGKSKKPPASKQQAAASAAWFLSTNDKWAQPYFDSSDLHCVDRLLFGKSAAS